MDNLKLPAYPVDAMEWDGCNAKIRKEGPMAPWSGFTKLEKAALMIASGMSGGVYSDGLTVQQTQHIASSSVHLAKAVLEEANK
jgi:hypothetical protein